MGLDNPIHIAFLLILLLLVFGAKRLPEMGRSLGSGMRGFKGLAQRRARAHLRSWPRQSSTPPDGHPAAAPAVPPVAPVREPVMAVVHETGAPVA